MAGLRRLTLGFQVKRAAAAIDLLGRVPVCWTVAEQALLLLAPCSLGTRQCLKQAAG